MERNITDDDKNCNDVNSNDDDIDEYDFSDDEEDIDDDATQELKNKNDDQSSSNVKVEAKSDVKVEVDINIDIIATTTLLPKPIHFIILLYLRDNERPDSPVTQELNALKDTFVEYYLKLVNKMWPKYEPACKEVCQAIKNGHGVMFSHYIFQLLLDSWMNQDFKIKIIEYLAKYWPCYNAQKYKIVKELIQFGQYELLNSLFYHGQDLNNINGSSSSSSNGNNGSFFDFNDVKLIAMFLERDKTQQYAKQFISKFTHVDKKQELKQLVKRVLLKNFGLYMVHSEIRYVILSNAMKQLEIIAEFSTAITYDCQEIKFKHPRFKEFITDLHIHSLDDAYSLGSQMLVSQWYTKLFKKPATKLQFTPEEMIAQLNF